VAREIVMVANAVVEAEANAVHVRGASHETTAIVRVATRRKRKNRANQRAAKRTIGLVTVVARNAVSRAKKARPVRNLAPVVSVPIASPDKSEVIARLNVQ
jgi:hypothetical protein